MSEATQPNDGFNIESSTVNESELSDNVAEDIVTYTRSNVISNEQQGYILTLAWSSGWMKDEQRFVNVVTIGTPSGGKTKLNRTMKQLLETNSCYSATDVSEAGIYNDHEKWNSKNVAIFSEWNKLSTPIREVIKSLAGEDGGASRTKSVQEDESTEWDADEQSLESKPYSFTYAQHSMDNEISDRLFFNYIDENLAINEAVTRKHAGHTNITVDGDNNYIFESSGLELSLKRHFRELPSDSRTHMPEWVYYAYEDCLDHKRSDVKRTGAMLPNLIRCSTLQNYHVRPTVTMDEDGHTVEKYVVKPQDVANVLSTRNVLLGTTHGFEPRKQGIVDAVRANTNMSEWCSLNDIQSWLNQNATEVSRLKKGSLREILDELQESFIIDVSKKHFDSGAHGYRFNSLTDIGHPKVTGFNHSQITYDSGDPFMGVDDPDNPFADCTDPFRDVPFKQSVEDFRQSLRRSVSSSASSAMNGSGGADDDSSQQQHTLSGDAANDTVIDDPIVAAVYDRLCDVDGGEFAEDVAHEDVLDLSDDGLLDPTHEVYRGTDVTSDGGAYSATEDSFMSLIDDGVVEIFDVDESRIRIEVDNTVEVDV